MSVQPARADAANGTEIEAAPREDMATAGLRDLFARFESLGNNCEFGIVQEAVGHNAPSLLRNCGFTSTNQVIRAIRAGLDGMFEPDTYAFTTPEGWPDYALDCLRYGIRFHTGLPISDARSAEKFDARIAAFRFMRDKLLDDLREGGKIFVYRHKAEFHPDLAARLLVAIRSHGPGRLLYVREDPRPERRFAWVEAGDRPGLFYGSIPCLSHENPPNINFAAWEKIARGALRLVHGESFSLGAPPPVEPPETPEGAGTAIEHRFFERNPFFSVVLGAAPSTAFTVSALLWVPASFQGDHIHLSMFGFRSDAFLDPDMAVRDRWQQISVTARVPEEHNRVVPALSASPNARGIIYTAGWTIHPRGANLEE